MGKRLVLHGSNFARGRAEPKNLPYQESQPSLLFMIPSKEIIPQVSVTDLCHPG